MINSVDEHWNKITCTFCKKQCTSVHDFRKHQRLCEANLLKHVQCIKCPKVFGFHSVLSKHMNVEHFDPEKKKEKYGTNCKFCDAVFSSLGSHLHGLQKGLQIRPMTHEKSCLKNILTSLKCCKCQVDKSSKEILLEHMEKEHQIFPPPYPCLKQDCDTISQNKKAREHHMFVGHGIRITSCGRGGGKRDNTLFCSLCLVDNYHESEEGLKQHKEHWHKVLCSVEDCNYTCESEKRLQEHGIKNHDWKAKEERRKSRNETKRPVSCHHCGHVANSMNMLRYHMQQHENKEFMCDKCDKVFPRALNLKMHMQNFHSDQTYVCQYCSKVFKKPRNLDGHINQYHKERNAICDICQKGFINKNRLKDHIISVHSKTTPFSCKYNCGKAYGDRSNCRQHERSVHEGNPRGPKAQRSNILSSELGQEIYSP